jgi:hypothetical protein
VHVEKYRIEKLQKDRTEGGVGEENELLALPPLPGKSEKTAESRLEITRLIAGRIKVNANGRMPVLKPKIMTRTVYRMDIENIGPRGRESGTAGRRRVSWARKASNSM